jgi:hypothetical protein
MAEPWAPGKWLISDQMGGFGELAVQAHSLHHHVANGLLLHEP